MGLVFALLLVIMGILVAQDFLLQKIPALRKFTDALNPYAEFIGFAGLLLGVLWTFKSFGMIRYIGVHPLLVIGVWLVSILTLLLGLILGLGLVHKFLEPPPAFLTTVDKWREKLLPHSKELGLAGIVMGVLSIL